MPGPGARRAWPQKRVNIASDAGLGHNSRLFYHSWQGAGPTGFMMGSDKKAG
jgi:hypothetical protein